MSDTTALKPLNAYSPKEILAGLSKTEPVNIGDLFVCRDWLHRCVGFDDGFPCSQQLCRVEMATALVSTVHGLCSQLADACNALERIATPVKAMSESLGPGQFLNFDAAARISNDPAYLKSIAKSALASINGETP